MVALIKLRNIDIGLDIEKQLKKVEKNVVQRGGKIRRLIAPNFLDVKQIQLHIYMAYTDDVWMLKYMDL